MKATNAMVDAVAATTLLGGTAFVAVIKHDNGATALRRLPTTMDGLWDVAYQRVDMRERLDREEQALRSLSDADRFLVHACYALAVLCAERDLRAAVHELANVPEDPAPTRLRLIAEAGMVTLERVRPVR